MCIHVLWTPSCKTTLKLQENWSWKRSGPCWGGHLHGTVSGKVVLKKGWSFMEVSLLQAGKQLHIQNLTQLGMQLQILEQHFSWPNQCQHSLILIQTECHTQNIDRTRTCWLDSWLFSTPPSSSVKSYLKRLGSRCQSTPDWNRLVCSQKSTQKALTHSVTTVHSRARFWKRQRADTESDHKMLPLSTGGTC